MFPKLCKYLYQNNPNFINITKAGKQAGSRYFYNSNQKSRSNCLKHCNRTICDNKKREDNLAAVLHKKNDLKIEKRPVPKINADQVLIQIEVVGLGVTDVASYKNSTTTKPIIMGHEASGIVLECGKNVKNLKPGDKVAIEPQIGCNNCYACKTGHYNLCRKAKYCGQPPQDGVLCRYCAWSADSCHKLPAALDFEQGSLIQPLSVVVHACHRAQVSAGDVVLFSSAGPIGLLGLLVAKLNGATKVVIIDDNDYNLKKATELGSTFSINVKGKKPMDVKHEIEEKMGRLPNKTIHCSHDDETIQSSIYSTRSGGQVAFVGLDQEFLDIPIKESIWRQVDLFGSYKSCNDYPRSIHMIDSGGLDPAPLVTHHFRLEEACKAFDMACKKCEPFLKIMIHCNPEWKPKC